MISTPSVSAAVGPCPAPLRSKAVANQRPTSDVSHVTSRPKASYALLPVVHATQPREKSDKKAKLLLQAYIGRKTRRAKPSPTQKLQLRRVRRFAFCQHVTTASLRPQLTSSNLQAMTILSRAPLYRWRPPTARLLTSSLCPTKAAHR